MYDVQNIDDAWELGVLTEAGFLSEADVDLAVIRVNETQLGEAYDAGLWDHGNLSQETITDLASHWNVG